MPMLVTELNMEAHPSMRRSAELNVKITHVKDKLRSRWGRRQKLMISNHASSAPRSPHGYSSMSCIGVNTTRSPPGVHGNKNRHANRWIVKCPAFTLSSIVIAFSKSAARLDRFIVTPVHDIAAGFQMTKTKPAAINKASPFCSIT